MQRVISFSHEEVVGLLSSVLVAEVEAMTGVAKASLVPLVLVENGKIAAYVRHADRHVHLLLKEDAEVYGKKKQST